MVSLHEAPERRVPLHRSFIEAAARAGVAQVVYLSFANAGPDAIFLHARTHGATEAMLADSGRPVHRDPQHDVRRRHAGLVRSRRRRTRAGRRRANELLVAARARARRRAHADRGRARRQDLRHRHARVGHARRARGDRIARDRPRVPLRAGDRRGLGRPLDRALGRTGWELEVGLSVYAALRAGELDVVTGDYEAVTGEKPATIEQLAAQLF